MADQGQEDEERQGDEDPIRDRDQDPGIDLMTHTSPRGVDGINHPSHERGVSVLTPEIISVFDVLPLFENPSQIAPAGNLFDVQVNARRVRINQMNALFEELTKDPKKDYAQIIERLKVGMIKEMEASKGDMQDLIGLYSNFYNMLISFDISSARNEPKVQEIMQRIRDSRNQNTESSLVYPTVREVEDFTEILKTNHRITDAGVSRQNSSNTKLLYYIAWDVYWRTMVTAANPTEIFTSTRRAHEEDWTTGESSRFRFIPRPGIGIGGGRTEGMTADRIGIGNNSQRLPFHPGRLGLSRYMLGTHDDDAEFGESLGYYSDESVLATFKAGPLEDPASDLSDASFFLSFACKDMAFSSVPQSDVYRQILTERLLREESALSNHPGQQIFKNSFPHWHITDTSSTNSLSYPRNFINVENDVTFARTIKKDPITVGNTSRPTPLFDPVLDKSPRGVFIENMQNLLRDKDSIQETLGNVSGLEDIAAGIEEVFALSVPDLQPVGILDKILEAFASLFERLNPIRPPAGQNSTNAGAVPPDLAPGPIYNDGDFLDLAILSECIKNIATDGEFPQKPGTALSNTTIPMIDLVNILLYKIGRNNGFYQNVSLHPGSTLRIGENQVLNPNIELMDSISSTIASYLTSRYDHLSSFFSNPFGRRHRQNLINQSYAFGGVYYKPLGFGHREYRESTSEEDTLDPVLWNASNSGHWDVRNRNVVHSPEVYNNVAKIMQTEKIASLVNQVVTDDRPSIFRDIVGILNDMDDAAASRGEYFQPGIADMNKMRHSSVDLSVIGSFVLQAFSKISHQLSTVTFNEVMSRGGRNDADNRSAWIKTHNRERLEQFDTALKGYRAQGVEYFDSQQGQSTEAGQLISNMINALRAERKVLIDAVDLFKAISLHADASTQTYLQLFEADNRVARLLETLDSDSGKILTIANPAQLALAGNKLEDVSKRLEGEQYFDTFMMNGSSQQAILSAFIRPEFATGTADNLKMMAVGIPDGFSRNVLNYDIMSNNDENKRSRVKVKVYRHDIILNDTILDFTPGARPGEARNGQVLKIKFKPKEFEFDMRTFFKGIAPMGGTGDTRVTQLDNEGNLLENPRRIDERNYLEINDVIQNHMIFRKFIERGATFNDVTYPFTGLDIDKQLFTNHCFDYIAKTYIRVMTGVDLAEESFLIDKEKENLTIDSREALEFFELVQGYVNDATNSETSLEDYLAGSRSTRELLRRLRGLPPAEPLLNSISVDDNNLPEELNSMLIEDIINFVKMINSHNLIFTASTDRSNLTQPKLFERIFCLFIDPDDFEIEGNMDGILRNKMIEAGLLNQDGTRLSQTHKSDGLPQFNQFYVEVI